MSKPTFSVIIPAFNAEATLSAALASVQAQTRQDFEAIVVDDGSTDGTAAVAERMSDSRIRLVSQPNRGLAAARNAGIEVSRGRLVAFLDSDDLWLPRYLECALEVIEATPDAGLAYTDAYAFDPISGRIGRREMDGGLPPTEPPRDSAGFLLELLSRNFIFVSTTVSREVLDEVGGFDTAADAAADYALWLQIIARGYRPAWMPGRYALYRIHIGQMSRDPVRLRAGELRALRMLEPDQMPTPAHRELLRRRCRELEDDMLRLGSGRSLKRLRTQLGRLAGELRRRTGYAYRWQERPPAEVISAFPDLRRL